VLPVGQHNEDNNGREKSVNDTDNDIGECYDSLECVALTILEQ
jgi:hypothetical protein